ncbi:AAA family ATPase [Glaciibacter sp. 2TAF33]|uniref:AAA family ATPase n=1 Tax=Glaciibacter sp. 2TAF33 TaxID=3233015 RepID=UPI003F9393E1
MKARRETQQTREREAIADETARLRRDEDEVLAAVEDNEVMAAPATPRHEQRKQTSQHRARPIALVERLHIQNLRSFAGPHDVPLAPITLIYGPNSAGKSTILKGLKLFMQVIDSGRSDALHPWDDAFKESAARTLMTYAEPDPDDPTGFQWCTPLVLGIDFRTHDNKLARAELGYDLNPVGSVDLHSTAIGLLDEGELSRKKFTPQDFADEREPFHPGDFGEVLLTRFIVEESRAGAEWSSETRLADAELFAHDDRSLQAGLFEMAFLLKYLGPHRGHPGRDYDPVSGAFNTSWFDMYRKPQRAGFTEFDLLNQMLAQLEIPYMFEQDPLAKLREPLERLWIMRDVRSGAPVALDQVGYGVSQLLPVIDLCVHAQKQIICVEEPELHLHPRLQARLGNLFATAAVGRGNQIIVETHSESILLRTRRLIRGGKLRPEEVAVIYVDNTGESGVTVRRLRLGERGELLDPWPTGFFDDGLADILGSTS